MTFLGLDPGLSGSICAVCPSGDPIAHKMPDTDKDLLDLLKSVIFSHDGHATAILEEVSSSPQMGVVSAFTFGRGFGKLEMALLAAEIPYEKVRPATWQKALRCMSKGDKNVTKKKAQELFPRMKVTHNIADGLLIATYCQRKYYGTL
jgi:Holliday junction resolvasome RuvABC endonuclease subunit